MIRVSNAKKWLRRNLFASIGDAIVTIVALPLLIGAVLSLLHWAVGVAQWHAVSDNLRVLMVGTLPAEMRVQAWIAVSIISTLVGITLATVVIGQTRTILSAALLVAMAALAARYADAPNLGNSLACLLTALLSYWLALRVAAVRRYAGLWWLPGFFAVLILIAPAGWDRTGGLLMSVLFTLAASALSVPLGVVLAFGRRSKLAGIRVICTAYIEVMRSLPLILVVYCIWVVTPLLSPEHAGPDLLRGLLGFSLFFAAYVAEYVRSGLQSVPKGQIEAAQSLGMPPYYINRDVVLPQAIRVVVPALVGNVLDIFNTVPLLFIIGITDFLRAGQMVLVNPQSSGFTNEIYFFMFTVYLAIASVITFGARKLEVRMAGNHR